MEPGNFSTLFLVSYVALFVLVAVLLVAVFLLYRHFGEQLLAMDKSQAAEGPKIGDAVGVVLQTIDGMSYPLGKESGARHVFLFASDGCSGCEQVREMIADLRGTAGSAENTGIAATRVVVVYAGDKQRTKAYSEVLPASTISVSDPRRELMQSWRVRRTPYFVVTDERGTVRAKGVATNRNGVESYLGYFKFAKESL